MLDELQARQFVVWERTGGGLRLVDRRRELSAFPIDWTALDRRRASDMSKLDAMQRYAYTTGCRRGFVLRYFGDPAASARCEGCDNCLGTHVSAAPARTEARRSRRSEPRGAAEKTTRLSADRRVAHDVELSTADSALIAALKSLRGAIARDAQLPAYCVFADRTLLEMAVRRPQSIAALADVRGVGPAKLEKYGERFLAAIREANDTEAA